MASVTSFSRDAHPVARLRVLYARLHGGDIVRLWTIPVSVSRINEYSPSPTDPRSQRGFRFSFNFMHIMVNFHYVALHLAHKSVLFISIQHTPCGTISAGPEPISGEIFRRCMSWIPTLLYLKRAKGRSDLVERSIGFGRIGWGRGVGAKACCTWLRASPEGRGGT